MVTTRRRLGILETIIMDLSSNCRDVTEMYNISFHAQD